MGGAGPSRVTIASLSLTGSVEAEVVEGCCQSKSALGRLGIDRTTTGVAVCADASSTR